MGDRFDTTRWSAVLAARDATGKTARDALSWLCEAYWLPLYAYVRRRGHGPDEAADLTQAYFTALLEKDYLKNVRRERGRFRLFLLKSMQHFLSNQWDSRQALKRGGDKVFVFLDPTDAEQRYSIASRDDLTPEALFDRRWALTLLDRVLDRMRVEARSKGRERQFELLSGFLTETSRHGTYRAAAEALGTSESAVKVAVYRLRRRFGESLRNEIAETVGDGSEVETELQHLLSVLQR